MPEFERNPYGWQDYHDQQLKHYGFKTGSQAASTAYASVSSQPNYRRNEATGMPVPVATPRRKPVPVASPAPTPRAQAPAYRTPRTQSPEGTRLIYTRADGRFDTSTIRMESSKYTPPNSPAQSNNRPNSSSSSQLPPPLKRTDSSNSKSSWRSRKDSASEKVRRLSDSLKQKAGIVAMDRNDRVRFVRDKHSTSGAPATPTQRGRSSSMSRGEKFALNISKKVDPIKARGRKGSGDSDMSLMFTDNAPAGALEPCKRCNRPIFEYATQGLCPPCHKEMKEKKKAAAKVTQQTEPDSPEAGYMKLPTAKKIVRLRQTMYIDPGNPFADDELPQQDHSAKIPKNSVPHLPPIPPLPRVDEGHLQQGPEVRRPELSKKAAAIRSPQQAELVGYPTASFMKRRSKSVALPMRESRTDGGYIPPRTLWQPGDTQTHGSVHSKTRSDDRDTKYYGYYDDIIPEYL